MKDKVTLKATRKGFTIYGSSVNSCVFVLSMKVGYMSYGARHISVDQCTEALLQDLEERFTVELLV